MVSGGVANCSGAPTGCGGTYLSHVVKDRAAEREKARERGSRGLRMAESSLLSDRCI